MRRVDIEWCKKHGNPAHTDSDVGFGPITIAELKRNVALADEVIKRKRITKLKKLEREKQEQLEEFQRTDKENEVENKLNRTFEIDEDLTQIDEKLISFNITSKPDNLDESRLPPYVSQHKLKDISNSNMNKNRCKIFNPSPFLSPSKKIQHKFTNSVDGCLIDETFNETMKAKLTTPLIDKYAMSRESPIKRGSPLSQEKPISVATPRVVRMSDTFINDLLPDDILINTTIDEKDQSQNKGAPRVTPDIFKEKQNNSWKSASSGQRLLPNSAVKSRLPKLKTPVKDRFLFVNSPVADYINRGTQVKSLSKARHSHCLEHASKSDQKPSQPCKIPVFSGVAKKKLNLNESKLLNYTLTKKL